MIPKAEITNSNLCRKSLNQKEPQIFREGAINCFRLDTKNKSFKIVKKKRLKNLPKKKWKKKQKNFWNEVLAYNRNILIGFPF